MPDERIEWVGRPGYKPGPPPHGYGYLWQSAICVVIGLALCAVFFTTLIRYGGFELMLYVILFIGDKESLTRDQRLTGMALAVPCVAGLAFLVYGIAVFWIWRMMNMPLGMNIRYAVTGRRALLLNAVPGKRVAVYDLRSFRPEVVSSNDDGSGTVSLAGLELDLKRDLGVDAEELLLKNPGKPLSLGDRAMLESHRAELANMKMPIAFANIADPSAVRDLILRLQREIPGP